MKLTCCNFAAVMLLLALTMLPACQSEVQEKDFVKGDPHADMGRLVSEVMMTQRMFHEMMEQKLPPEVYVALGAYFQANSRWPKEARELEPYGWTSDPSGPLNFSPQADGCLGVTYGGLTGKQFLVCPPRKREPEQSNAQQDSPDRK